MIPAEEATKEEVEELTGRFNSKYADAFKAFSDTVASDDDVSRLADEIFDQYDEAFARLAQ